MSVSTRDIVAQSLVKVEEKCNLHDERVLAFIGKGDIKKTTTYLQVKELKEGGFSNFVKKDIEQKFQYKCGVNGSYTYKTNGKLKWILGGIFTILGLIIPPILAVLMNDMDILIGMLFSLTGPVIYGLGRDYERDKAIDYIGDIPDSVMDKVDEAIGQCGIMNYMIYSCDPLPTKEVLTKVDPVMIGWLDDNETGVVIGIWDRDKEINVLD